MHLLALIALGLWLYAFINAVLNLLLIHRLPVGQPADGPLVSVIIPARNEERAIERTIRSFLAQRYANLEVVVVDDRSTDTTGAVAQRISGQDHRVRAIVGEELPDGWLGKPWAMQQGARQARGELLLFVDADLVYWPEAVASAVAELRRTDAAMVTLLPNMELESFWEHLALPMLAMAFFVMLPSWLGNRTRFARLGLGGGTGNLIRRSAYDVFGGHEALKSEVVDDIQLAQIVRRHGGRTLALRADHLITLHMYDGGGEIVRGFTKNMFAAIGQSYVAAFVWLLLGLVGSILPYVFALTGDVTSIITVGLISVTRLLVFSTLRYRLDNALFGHPLMMTFWAWVLVRSAWFSGVRGQVSWRGRTYPS